MKVTNLAQEAFCPYILLIETEFYSSSFEAQSFDYVGKYIALYKRDVLQEKDKAVFCHISTALERIAQIYLPHLSLFASLAIYGHISGARQSCKK